VQVNKGFALVILLIAAALEAGGDALVRMGLQSTELTKRFELILLGGFVLLSYGLVVNLPSWDFGRLLGIYVTLFFLVAQIINYFGFGQKPSMPILVGGAFIMAGGLIISLWKA
jgi:drug/metabolite transporter superfamily protein YnfA